MNLGQTRQDVARPDSQTGEKLKLSSRDDFAKVTNGLADCAEIRGEIGPGEQLIAGLDLRANADEGEPNDHKQSRKGLIKFSLPPFPNVSLVWMGIIVRLTSISLKRRV